MAIVELKKGKLPEDENMVGDCARCKARWKCVRSDTTSSITSETIRWLICQTRGCNAHVRMTKIEGE